MKAKRYIWNKTFIVFITFILFITNSQLTAFAGVYDEFSDREIQNAVNSSILSKEYSDTIAAEITAQRDQHSKTFLMDDGSYYTIVSDQSIHSLNDNKWQSVIKESDKSFKTVQDVDKAILETMNVNEEISAQNLRSDYTDESNSVLCAATDAVEKNGVFNLDMLELSSSYLFIKPDFVDTFSSENKVVTKAICNLTVSTVYDNANLSIYEETYDWENNINASGLVNYKENNHNLLLDKKSVSENDSREFNIDVTNSFVKWERNKLDNNGICIKIQSDDGEVYISNISFSIRYVNADTDNTNYTYHTLDLGKVGIISVNDITNAFSVTQNIAETVSNKSPVKVSRKITSVAPTLDADGNVGGNLNYGNSLKYYGNVMVWTTTDGMNVRFVETDELKDGYVKWKQITENAVSFASLYVKNSFVPEVNNMDYSKCYVEDSGYRYDFCNDGKLKKISGNNYTMNLNYGEYGILSISDSNGNRFSFGYDSYKIRTTTYRYINNISVYDINNNLIPSMNVDINVKYNSVNKKITSKTDFADGSSVSYIFDNYGLPEQIICDDSSVVNFIYADNENPYIIGFEQKSGETVKNSLFINSDDVYYRIFTDQNNQSEYYYYNTKYQLTTYCNDANNHLTGISYDENGYLYSYATLEKESVLKNHNFTENPKTEGSWEISNNSFYSYNESSSPHLTLSPSEASINFTQSFIPNDSVKLKKGETIVFGIKGLLNNTYPVLNEDHNIGAAIKITYSDRSTESHSLEFDSSLLNTNQILLKAVKLKNDCRKISYTITVKNQEGSLAVDDAILFSANESEEFPFYIETSDIESSENYSAEFDENGNITEEKIIYGDQYLSNTYQYDSLGRMVSETDYNNINSFYEYDSSDSKCYKYGNVLDENGSIKNPTEFVYNSKLLLESINAAVTNLNGVENKISVSKLNTILSYDSYDKIKSATNNGVTYTFNYYDDGNIESVSVSGKDDNGNNKTEYLQEYEYNADSNINSILFGNGSKITYVYNDGKISSVAYSLENAETPLSNYQYFYDGEEICSVICNISNGISEKNKKFKIVYEDKGYKLFDFIEIDNLESERIIYETSGDVSSKKESYYACFGDVEKSKMDNVTTSFSSNRTENTSTDTMSCSVQKTTFGFLPVDFNVTSVITKDEFGRIKSNEINNNFFNQTYPDNTHSFNYNAEYSYLNSENGKTNTLLSEYAISGDIPTDSSLPETFTASTVLKYDARGNLQFKYYKTYPEEFPCIIKEGCNSYCKCGCSKEKPCMENCKCSYKQTYYYLGNFYGYDEQNQLVCEADFIYDKYAEYAYDESGNLCRKRIFDESSNLKFTDKPDFDLKSLIEIEEEIFKNVDFSKFSNSLLLIDNDAYYEYNYSFDSVYKDRMIEYTEKECVKKGDSVDSVIKVNEKINYDNCGNPLNYIGYNYEGLVRANLKWCGNLLTEFDMLDENGEIIRIFTYEYDQNEYRTVKKKYIKNENGIFDLHSEQNYIWENGVLQGIVFKGTAIDYLTEKDVYSDNFVTYSKIIYDANGAPIAFITPLGAMYQYVKDFQGNIIGLHNGESLYVEMSYDSWGQLSFLNYPGVDFTGYDGFMMTALFNPCTFKGYLYDYESGMYYAKNECYAPSWGRNISNNGDYSDMMRASSEPLDYNPYLFCSNNLITNSDIYSSWSTHDNSLSFFDSGFEISVSKAFLSRPLCELYASQLIKKYGSYNYNNGLNLCGMDKKRIAINLFANAVGHYSPKAINKVNAAWGIGWLDSLSKNMFGKIVLKSNEKEYIVKNYEKIWLAAPSIKNYAWSNGIFITI